MDAFKVWIDRLTEGQVQKIDASYDPAFLDVEESELQFRSPVAVSGEAYLADDTLVLRLKAKTIALMPCIICNKMIETKLEILELYHTESLSDIRGAIFDFSEALREALLIELPKYVECGAGKCPERQALAPYLRKPEKKETHCPFADLESD
jgi:uncharacterized metal-binding protein YceD (DUF177 family)